MAWTTSENTEAISGALELAAARGASLCIFPELALTGFHRRIREQATCESVMPSLSSVRALCGRLGIAAVLGAPFFGDGGQLMNGIEFIDRTGQSVGQVQKIGLTAPEATLFGTGRERPIITINGLHTTAVICREIHDRDELIHSLGHKSLDVIFWPGIMRPDPDRADRAENYIDDARALARELSCHIVQANWPNSLNYPAEGAEQGHSAVISPHGTISFRLPKASAGLGVFVLGDSKFDWIADS